MNHDEKFQQRWDFRRREVDGDSSSDDSNGDPKVKIICPKNDDVIDAPMWQRDDRLIVGTKITKKKNVVKRKPKKCLVVKENKRKRKVKPEEMVISKDLKIFGDSLIDELKAARENMFAHMREEMNKLTDLRSNVNKKNNMRRCSKKRKSRPSTKITRVISAVESDQVIVSSSYLTLPSVVPKPHFQNYVPPMNNLGSEIEIAKLIDAKKTYQQCGSFSCKSSGQNPNIGFPVSLYQALDNSSNASTLTCADNSFLNNSKVGPRLNSVGFSSSSNMAYKSDEEFVSRVERTQRWPVLATNI